LSMRVNGVRLFPSQRSWLRQPLLAGIKHLNAAGAVLARSEWTDNAVR